MKTKIFSYKGVVGAQTDIDNGKFINDVHGPGQLGCVIHTSEVQITSEAKEIIRNARRERGSFAPIMLTRHDDGSGSSIAIMGFRKHMFSDVCIGRSCDISILDDCETLNDMEIPEGFIKAVENM